MVTTDLYELQHKKKSKQNNLHMRKQKRRSASQYMHICSWSAPLFSLHWKCYPSSSNIQNFKLLCAFFCARVCTGQFVSKLIQIIDYWVFSCEGPYMYKLLIKLSPIRMRKKYTRVNILRCVFILRCANQPESKFKLRSHGFYRQEYFCR